jgi:hypothetical protein
MDEMAELVVTTFQNYREKLFSVLIVALFTADCSLALKFKLKDCSQNNKTELRQIVHVFFNAYIDTVH